MDSDAPATPAARVIAAFGGVPNLAREIQRDVSRIYRWTYPAERGGTAGQIPGSAMPDILAASARLGLGLTPDDLFDAPAAAPTPEQGRDAA